MKSRIRTFCCVAICLCAFSASADRWVAKVSWHGTAYTTSSNGRIVARPYSGKTIVDETARNTGLSPQSLVFAYVHDDEEPSQELDVFPVVSNSAFTKADIIQFYQGHAVTETIGSTTISRQMRFIFDENHGSALGSISGTETIRRNAGGDIVALSFRGRFEFTVPEDNTVYVGTFSTGAHIPNR